MPLKHLSRNLHGDSAITLVNKFSNLEKKYIKTCNSLTFLLRCRDSKLIPKGLSLKFPVKSTKAQKITKKCKSTAS